VIGRQHWVSTKAPGGIAVRECEDGKVLSLFPSVLIPDLHMSRFDVILKGASGKGCLVLDLSLPEDNRK